MQETISELIPRRCTKPDVRPTFSAGRLVVLQDKVNADIYRQLFQTELLLYYNYNL